MGGGGRECPPTRVGALFVPPPPPAYCRRTDAEAFKECLNAYLEGLIVGGADLALQHSPSSFHGAAAVAPPSADIIRAIVIANARELIYELPLLLDAALGRR